MTPSFNRPLLLSLKMPLTRKTADPSEGNGIPSGFSLSTINGMPLEYRGSPIFDNLPKTPISVRAAA